jgi:hypothetical protein
MQERDCTRGDLRAISRASVSGHRLGRQPVLEARWADARVVRVASAFVQHGQATTTGPHLRTQDDLESVNFSPDGYLLGSYRIATAPEPSSSRLTSLKSTCFDSPANNAGL